jgi:hypothetical protein
MVFGVIGPFRNGYENRVPFDWENQTPSDVAKKQEQEILELKQK